MDVEDFVGVEIKWNESGRAVTLHQTQIINQLMDIMKHELHGNR